MVVAGCRHALRNEWNFRIVIFTENAPENAQDLPNAINIVGIIILWIDKLGVRLQPRKKGGARGQRATASFRF